MNLYPHLLAVLVASCFPAGGMAQEVIGGHVLLRRSLESELVQLVAIDAGSVIYRDASGQVQACPVDSCIALLPSQQTPQPSIRGFLQYTDGRVFPGHPVTRPEVESGKLVWGTREFGDLVVSLEEVAAVRFRGMEPLPTASRHDVLSLHSGSLLEGFIVSLSNPVILEARIGEEATQQMQFRQQDCQAAVLLFPPREGTGMRIWQRDGTVLDVQRFSASDEGYVLLHEVHGITARSMRMSLLDLSAVQFQREGFVPLAELSMHVTAVPGSPRYRLPRPEVMFPGAAAGLGPIKVRGPLHLQVDIPAGADLFSAQVQLPEEAWEWGDVELVVSEDGRDLLRTTMNSSNSTIQVAVGLSGTRLSITLLPGKHGPVMDWLVLVRAAFRVPG